MPPIVSTERLLLREMTAADAAHCFDLNNDPDVLRFTGEAPFPDVEAARAFLDSYPAYREDGFGRWAVEKHDGTWLGWCGLRRQPNGEVDLGYRLLPALRGQGFATEASLACLRIGFERFRLPAIIAQVDPAKHPSIRVLEKVGMQMWKTGPCGHHEVALIYRLEREAWNG
jgi:RimJ/RimL family protein N-acetyltransferase